MESLKYPDSGYILLVCRIALSRRHSIHICVGDPSLRKLPQKARDSKCDSLLPLRYHRRPSIIIKSATPCPGYTDHGVRLLQPPRPVNAAMIVRSTS